MKFDFVIGNPPYMEQTESESTRMPPVYNYFMDEAYKIADVVELITPARFFLMQDIHQQHGMKRCLMMNILK